MRYTNTFVSADFAKGPRKNTMPMDRKDCGLHGHEKDVKMITCIVLLVVFLLEPGGAEDVLIFSDARRHGVYQMAVAGGQHVRIGNQSWANPTAVGYDPSDNNVFVTEHGLPVGHNFIGRFNVDSNSFKRKDLPGASEPDGIAVDAVSRLVYYTDACDGKIAVMDVDFTWHRVLYRHNLRNPRAIAVHPIAGRMFWTDWGPRWPHIGRAFMDGSRPEVIVNRFVGWPNGLYVDTQRDELFWCDARTFRVERSALDGTNRRVIVRRPGEHFVGIVADDNYLYWTAWNQPAVQRAPRIGSGRTESLGQVFPPTTAVRLTGLTIAKDARPLTVRNACSGRDRGGCQQLCLPVGTSRVCACNDGLRIQADNVSCQTFAFRRGLVFTDASRRGVFVLDLGLTANKPVRISGSFVDPRGIVFDPQERKVYWTDSAQKSISSASLDGSDVNVIRHLNRTDSYPEGIAIDVAGRMLYVVDDGRGVIMRIPTTGRNEDVLVRKTDVRQRLRSIVLDVPESRMYWTDWGTPAVWTADLNGSRPRVVVTGDLGWPNGLAIDHTEKSVYWVDGLLQRIERVRVDGTDRKVLFANPLLHPAGLTLGRGKIYFSVLNTGTRSVYEVDRANLTRAVPVRGVYHGRVYDLDFLTDGSPPATRATSRTPSPTRSSPGNRATSRAPPETESAPDKSTQVTRTPQTGSPPATRATSKTPSPTLSSALAATDSLPPEPLMKRQQESGYPTQTESAPDKSTKVTRTPQTDLPIAAKSTSTTPTQSAVTEPPVTVRSTSRTPSHSAVTEMPVTSSSTSRTPAQSAVTESSSTSTPPSQSPVTGPVILGPAVTRLPLNSDLTPPTAASPLEMKAPSENQVEKLTDQRAASKAQARGNPWPMMLIAAIFVSQVVCY